VIFIRHALPGERVRVQITEVTTRFARAEAVEILSPSPDRVEAPCPSARPFGCGGCDWQHAALPAQRALKSAVVTQQLRRLAGIDREVTVEPLPEETQPGEETGLGWRTRMQFAVSPEGRAGLRGHRSHEVIDVGDCLIAHPAIRDLNIPALPWAGAESVEAVATGDETAVIVVGQSPKTRSGDKKGRSGGKKAGPGDSRPADKQPEGVASVGGDSVLTRAGRRLTPIRGRAYLHQQAGGRDWRVSAGAFWQVHPAAADTLTAAVLEFLGPREGDTALDLYCGAGLFAGALAPLVGAEGAVIGIESDESAVRDARHNLRDTPWVRIRRGDVAEVLRASRKPGGSTGSALPLARLAVADPPRAGLARSVVDDLSSGGTERFAYVSCDPATLARDLKLLLARGWRLEGLRAFDAFPMTHHVECVAVLARF
jgi:tRNA/tmRNA/rRNA uracil-C5-methylase (TrmA/RlmC/RlmD family)